MSQHLRVLETARLVRVDPRGTRRFYSIRQEGLDALKQYRDGFWTDALTAYAAEITRRNKENGAAHDIKTIDPHNSVAVDFHMGTPPDKESRGGHLRPTR